MRLKQTVICREGQCVDFYYDEKKNGNVGEDIIEYGDLKDTFFKNYRRLRRKK